MPRPLPRIAVTMGDPAGIGPEILLKALAEPAVQRVCVPMAVASRALLERVAGLLSLPVPSQVVEPDPAGFDAAALQPGRISAAAGAMAGACIEEAIAGCRAGRYAALVTNPISKAAVHAAGIPFPGHTEWLAERCGVQGEFMLMYHRRLAVVLTTCHQSLASVPATLSPGRIVAAGTALAQALRRIRRREPRLCVCGYNPHAGEGGMFGDEDERLVAPAVAELRRAGIDAEGPLPPDTAFSPANRRRFDGHVAMYHDQGLIAFKALYFDSGVNVTLGLPIVRTSVDHGTAFDIAWRGVASHRSLVEAVVLAAKMSG
jgi:4-hydroxythreonine-4-phosphate dehydrogenase